MKSANRLAAVAAVGLAGVWAAGGATAGAADPADPPAAVARRLFALATVDPTPAVARDPLALAADWPAFRHADFKSAGFNAVVLPFHYDDPKHLGDADEANALSFMLSYDLDWSPASYANRRAYFVYQRPVEAVQPLVTTYDTGRISALIDRWTATHAVGGTVTRTADGYAGELLVFDSAGSVEHRESFDKPRPYFDLLGDLSVAALTYLGPPPGAALVKHLHEPRCQHMSSVAALGKAAFMDPRKAEEWQAYDTILAADQGFAQVRYWRANQGGFRGLSAADQAKEYAASLESYPTAEACRTIRLNLLPDDQREAAAAAQRRGWELADPDAPQRLAIELTDARAHQRRDDPDLVARGMAAAAKYPNRMEIVETLEASAAGSRAVTPDPDLAASLELAAVQGLFLPGSGSKADSAADFAASAAVVGRADDGVPVLLDNAGDGLDGRGWFTVIDGLTTLGQWNKVLETYAANETAFDTGPALVEADVILAAGMLGRTDVLDHLLVDRRVQLDRRHNAPLAEAYKAVLAGNPVDAAPFDKAAASHEYWQSSNYLLLRAQLDLNGKAKLGGEVYGASKYDPGRRPLWVLVDAYERKLNHPDVADFYRSLAWLYPDDAWVRAAVAAWTARCPGAAAGTTDVAKVTAALQPYPARRWSRTDPKWTAEQKRVARNACSPWQVGAAVAAEAAAGRADDAKALALRYVNVAAQLDDDNLTAWADHVYYQVDARAAAAPRP